MTDDDYFVSYSAEVKLREGGFQHWPNCRILRGRHPLEWHRSVIDSGGRIVLIAWQKLSAEEATIPTQVIEE